MFSSFYVRPSAGEQVCSSITLQPDSRPSLIGTALDAAGKPMEQVLVVLTLSGKSEPDSIAGVTYTDALGRFAFGPLDAGALYQISLYADSLRCRTLEQPEG